MLIFVYTCDSGGPALTVDNMLKTDLDTAEAALIEVGLDHCCVVALNIFFGNLFCNSLSALLRVICLSTAMSFDRMVGNYIKKRGCPMPEGPIVPYVNPDGTRVWLKFNKFILEDA